MRKLKRPTNLSFYSYMGDVAGCGTIRVIYPYLLLNHYKEMDKNNVVNLNIIANYGQYVIPEPKWYEPVTFCQFQRAATAENFKVFKWFNDNVRKQTNTPIIYEIDDDLFNIPEWNYAHKWYSPLKPFIKDMMKMSDAIIVSTPRLKKLYSKYNNKIEVIPNHLPKFIWGDIFLPDYENKKTRILYAGSKNHFNTKGPGGDFGKELINFIKKTTDKYEWVISGGIPFELESIKDKIEYHEWKNIFEYPNHVKDLEVDIAVAPLQDIEFNHGKSNIKMLEYTALGIPGIYSNVEPYYDATIKCNTDEEMIDQIEILASNLDIREKVWYNDYTQVKDNLYWEENDNIKKYINTYLGLFNKKL